VVAPVPVQGEGAAAEIADAIRRMNAWGGAQVLIVGRGGGSMEDLWAFNEEPVVRAVARSRIPVISAVGHETDVTLCDLAADRRAATPSNAAEIAVPDARDVALRVRRIEGALLQHVMRGLSDRRRRVESIASAYGFRRPHDFIARGVQRVDDLSRRLSEAVLRRLLDRRRSLAELERRFGTGAQRALAERRARVERFAGALSGLDPRSVLRRGYCLVARSEDGRVVRSAVDLSPGTSIRLRFHADAAEARVTAVHPTLPADPTAEN